MPNMKSLPPMVKKLMRILKLTTDKQTYRQDKNSMLPIIQSGGIKINTGNAKHTNSYQMSLFVIYLLVTIFQCLM